MTFHVNENGERKSQTYAKKMQILTELGKGHVRLLRGSTRTNPKFEL